MEEANNSTITKLFDSSMSIIWLNTVIQDYVLLFVSNAALSTEKAGKNIQIWRITDVLKFTE